MIANECTFERSTVAKLRKRIFLPPEVYVDTHEERHVVSSLCLTSYLESFNSKSGWSIIYLDHRVLCKQAEQIEVIKRVHTRLGKFILFRVWKQDNKQLSCGKD